MFIAERIGALFKMMGNFILNMIIIFTILFLTVFTLVYLFT